MKHFLSKDLVIPRSVLLVVTFLALVFSLAVIYNTILATQASTKADNAIRANKHLLEETSHSDHGILQRIHSITVDNCSSIQIIKAELKDALETNLISLPNIIYYRTHPNDLAARLAQIEVGINALNKHSCQRSNVLKLP